MGVLRDLLDAKEPLFSKTIERLEKASGEQGLDGRLIAEIAAKIRTATADLGLGPKDTLPTELYAAVMVRVEHDNRRLASSLGGRNPDDMAEMVPLILKTVHTLNTSKQAWVLKHDTARQLLRSHPPRRLIKELGYESVDDLLTHEPIEELYIAIRFSETPEWTEQHIASFELLHPDNFERRDIQCVCLESERYATLATPYVFEKLHNVTHSKELGVIGILPNDATLQPKGFTLLTLSLLLHYLNEVRMYSAFFRLQSKQPDFGLSIAKTLTYDPHEAADIAGTEVHWRVLQRYFGKHGDIASRPEFASPHVHPEDIIWRQAEHLLMTIEPSLSFWHDMDFVGMRSDKGSISFNLIDAVLNYAYSRSFADAYTYHFRESLWNELFSRYLGTKTLQEQVLLQLASHEISLEALIDQQ